MYCLFVVRIELTFENVTKVAMAAAVCCSVMQCVAVCCIVLQCVAVCCSVLQCVLQCVHMCDMNESCHTYE